MIDESMDDSYLSSEPKPYEFRSKNMWQKLLVMTAGVIMNLLLAVAIFTGIVFTEGKTIVETTTVGYVEKKSVAEAVGLQAGDKVLTINGEQPKSWGDLVMALSLRNAGDDKILLVRRGETTTLVKIPGKTITDALAAQTSPGLGLLPANTAVVLTAVETLRPAGKLGLMAGDTVLRVNGAPIVTPSQLVEVIKAHAGAEIFLDWKRGALAMSGKITPDKDGRIGVAIDPAFKSEGIRRERYGIVESVGLGSQEIVAQVALQANAVSQIFKGKVSAKQTLGGPIQIAKMSRQSAAGGFLSLMKLTGLLSVVLALFNILPFPALDGGHVAFILVEGIIRREVPVKVKMAIQQAGIVVLLGFMVFVIYNDLTR